MRLLAVSALADVAGGEITLLRALPALQRRGWEIRLSVPGSGRLESEARSRGIATVRIPLGPPDRRTAAALAGAAAAVPHLLRSDVAWLNGLPTQRLLASVLATRRQAVLRVNNPLSEPPKAWGRPGFWHAVSAVIADSEASAAECRAAGAPAERVHALYPPAWSEDRPPTPRAETSMHVGFVGQIEPRKGVLELVQAADIFLKGRPEARLTIIGTQPEGADTGYLDAVRQAAGEDERIAFRGYVRDAAAEIAGFDLLAVPSHAEPFGTVAAEAAAVGVPVVASRVGGLPEVVGDGGLLVAPEDPQALAEAIGALLDDPPRRQTMGRTAQQGAVRFSPERFVERLGPLLTDAAGGGR